MKFKLEITETDNAAFDDGPATEIARILEVAAKRVRDGWTEGALLDANGNRVGRFYATR